MRGIVLFILLVVGVGFFLQTGISSPYLHWVGHLPGDLVLYKGQAKIYLPLTTSLLVSVALSFILNKCRKI